MTGSSHFDAAGNARMVDVSGKEPNDRTATAKARVVMSQETLATIAGGAAKKGDVLAVARLAGIMAAKQTSQLIPLCHPLSLTSVTVDLVCDAVESAVDITATCRVRERTGVEMEAMTAAAITALTVYDMCKSLDRGMRIEAIRLVHKSGGSSGTFEAD
ncbi:MAG: cyclic pyranopterin monophosphate synthase MoaC [Rhodospirillales bacterium]|nr:cyclic pyranopterin monophosphate synthase MoaC [Rhodospirillales bacterium]